jgi:hypothetical protein
MRTGYAVTKVVTFCGLALAQAFSGLSPDTVLPGMVPLMMQVFQVTAWLAVAFCIFRGLPVIISSLRRYWGIPSAAPAG